MFAAAHLFSASQISLGWLSSLRREVMADSTLADFWVANSERVACTATRGWHSAMRGWHSAMCGWQTANGWPACYTRASERCTLQQKQQRHAPSQAAASKQRS